MDLLNILNISKTYGNGIAAVEALNDINIRIEEGEFIGIIGASGSGKSTLLHSSYWFLSSTIGKLNGMIMIPIKDITINIVVCIVSLILAAIYPAIKVSRLSPINAINTQIGISSYNQNDLYLEVIL